MSPAENLNFKRKRLQSVGRIDPASVTVKPEDAFQSLPSTPHILVVDTNSAFRRELFELYHHQGFQVTLVASTEQALEAFAKIDADLVVTNIQLPGLSGVELAARIRKSWPEIPIIAISGRADIVSAVNILKLGASDYILAPMSPATILESTRIMLKKTELFIEIRRLRQTLRERCEFEGMISTRPEMHRVFEIICLVSKTDATVVVEGETGTGKELVASAIHHQSNRRNGPFVTINCAGLPESLLESELFGYERGAFTGAERTRPGKIELAHGGTLFLDEIENVTPLMQTKLLRALQDHKVQRLGSSQWIHVDMRAIAASNVSLKALVGSGKMRRDFYHRINVVPIRLIPLRERMEDVPLLVQDFLRKNPTAGQKNITRLTPQAMNQLTSYDWPGNIRELQNVVEKAIVLARSRTIKEVDIDKDTVGDAVETQPAPGLPLIPWIQEQEKRYISQKLQMFQGRIGMTAKDCGVDARTIYRKMRQYGLDKKDFQASPE